MTLQEIKNKVRKAHHYSDWDEKMIDEVAELYAQENAKAMILEYAKWYEECLPEDKQNEEWMIEQNVKSFFDVRL